MPLQGNGMAAIPKNISDTKIKNQFYFEGEKLFLEIWVKLNVCCAGVGELCQCFFFPGDNPLKIFAPKDKFTSMS